MTEKKIKNRDSDSQALTKGHKAGHAEGQGVKTRFFGSWIFITVILGVFLSPIGEKFVGYLKFRAKRTALEVGCEQRAQVNDCIKLSQLHFLYGDKKDARKYQKDVCTKFNHLEFCREKI